MGGHEKLAQLFGLYIYGIIDTFSQKILALTVLPDKKKKTVCNWFVSEVRRINGEWLIQASLFLIWLKSNTTYVYKHIRRIAHTAIYLNIAVWALFRYIIAHKAIFVVSISKSTNFLQYQNIALL